MSDRDDNYGFLKYFWWSVVSCFTNRKQKEEREHSLDQFTKHIHFNLCEVTEERDTVYSYLLDLSTSSLPR